VRSYGLGETNGTCPFNGQTPYPRTQLAVRTDIACLLRPPNRSRTYRDLLVSPRIDPIAGGECLNQANAASGHLLTLNATEIV
jgi:hypothetical protein